MALAGGPEYDGPRTRLGDYGDQYLTLPVPPPPPPPPLMSRKGVVAVDVTEKFISAAQTLKPGELVKCGYFTLFESVGALEIMDPKMDSGCEAHMSNFEEQYDVRRPLLPEEVLGLIDQMLCLEMAWHSGYPLAQTLFTSEYVDAMLSSAPKTIQEADFVPASDKTWEPSPMHSILRAYCIGMLKACGYVNERIKNEHYYEEEDFVTNTYDRTLLESIDLNTVLLFLQETRALLLTLQGSVPDQILEALQIRLTMRHSFLTALDASQSRSEPDLIRGPWKDACAVAARVKATSGRGTPIPESVSIKLQRKLATTMPPRPIVEVSLESALGQLVQMFKDGLEVVDVLHYTDSQCLLTFVETFQAKKPQPVVMVRSMLQMFLFHEMEVLGTKSIRQILDDDFAIMTLPSHILLDRANDEVEAPRDPRFIMAQSMEDFRQKAARPYLDILRTFCQNRSRVRRTLCRCLRDWESLQVEAEDIDQYLLAHTKEKPLVYRVSDTETAESYSLPLSSWVYYYKLRLMADIVQLGFELEVYQPDELGGMYWLLKYLTKTRLDHIDRIALFVTRHMDQTRAGGRGSVAIEEQFARTRAFIRLAQLDAAATWELADALSCLYTALDRLALIKSPPRPYGTDELRYEVRMKPFTGIGIPTIPTFEEFAKATSQADSPTGEVLHYASLATASARKAFDKMTKLTAEESFSVDSRDRWLPATKNGMKSCIALGIAIAATQKILLAKQLQEQQQQADGRAGSSKNSAASEASSAGVVPVDAEVQVPTPAKAYHEFWIVPKVITPAR